MGPLPFGRLTSWFKSGSTIPAVAAISFCVLGGTGVCRPLRGHALGDYPTIRAGSNAAVTGDEIVVADGVYTGDGSCDLDVNFKWEE